MTAISVEPSMLLISPSELTLLSGRDISSLRRLENQGRLVRLMVADRPQYRWVDASPLIASTLPTTWRKITRALEDVSVTAAREAISTAATKVREAAANRQEHV